MSATHCLNCGMLLQGKYCHTCGQKGATHRISMKHFLMHDLVHGLWHLDGAFPRALKNALLWPGKTARAYIAGQRAGQFNLITLLLILFALNFYAVRKLQGDEITRIVRVQEGEATADTAITTSTDTAVVGKSPAATITSTTTTADGREFASDLLVTLRDNAKWIFLATIPLLSLASLIVWRRARLNYAEHLVVSSFFLAGASILNFITTVIDWGIGRWLGQHVDVTSFLLLPFFGLTYWQAYRSHYRLGGWLWRVLVLFILFSALIAFATVAAFIVYFLLGDGRVIIKRG